MLLIFFEYLIHHKMEVHAANIGFKMFNTWFFNECIIKRNFLRQYFCFFLIPKTNCYMADTNENNEDNNKK